MPLIRAPKRRASNRTEATQAVRFRVWFQKVGPTIKRGRTHAEAL